MNRLESIVKWIAVTACLVGASGTSFAAAPDAAAPDHPLAPLTAAYVRAVTPGQQADTYRELLGVVLARVQRSFALEVDTPAFIAAALKAGLIEHHYDEPGRGAPPEHTGWWVCRAQI